MIKAAKDLLRDPRRLFFAFLVVSIGAYLIWSQTDNRIAAAVLILVGTCTVPIPVMVFLFNRLDYRGGVTARDLANVFMVGGAIGLIIAGFLEYNLRVTRTLGGDLSVGVIEESAKIIFPLILFYQWRFKKLSDGILIGAASGMGFAVLETIGKGLIVLADGGNVGYTMLTRGFFTPFGHPAWTALICVFLWLQRSRGRVNTAQILGIFVLAAVLHGIWDAANQLDIPDIATAGLLMLISIFTMSVLFFQFEKAERENNGA
ncbi:Membrane proteinase PrsW, cleaves anti-sigma factor RsiW, M82 family [Dehalogenimonas formicexedens]|uniref:Membrane proteinase PrsW, cleaves anti-sigma factor RsiW, M82 family n=1 Tax=Dehalogenimonas formicexedens TaxID=1839801 RepID=A0A1P8F7I0_9CHLR|nr:PrsW family intramembrane metalloprotease [Dehalogenimonas formicexedens]APV44322.1 Membrane proteinase PrsW, cleaves anti-sigma factor RsiW, M82 family [Dehalogenimonas formicexedens]